MEFAAAAMTSVASAIGGVKAALAPVGTLIGALGPVASIGATILSGSATVNSVMAAHRAGEQQQWAHNMQALDAETNVQVEEVQGLERRNSLRAALVQAIGERDVATAASGVDLSFGTPVVARREAVRDTERALTVDQATQDLRVARLRERAANYRIMGVDARSGALARAEGIAVGGLASVLRRG